MEHQNPYKPFSASSDFAPSALNTYQSTRRAPSSGTRRMPKDKALALTRWLKRCIAIIALVGFGTLSGLVMTHKVTNTEQQTTSGDASTSDGSSTPAQTPYATTSPWEQGGYSFGDTDPEQPPVSRSHAS